MRIEAQMEQLDQVAREAGVAVERVGEVAQAERRAELAQIGGIGPQHRHLAPLGAGRDDQPIEAVVVGLPAQHGEEAALQPLVVALELDGRRRRRSPAPCRAASRRARRPAKRGRM